MTEIVPVTPYDVKGTILAIYVVPESKNSKNAQSYSEKVVERNLALSNSIMPPAEVRKTIEESCKKSVTSTE